MSGNIFFTHPFTSYLLLLTSCFFFISCENDIAKINLITSINTMPVESGKNVEIIYSDSAKVKIKLISPQVDRYTDNDPHTEMSKGVKIEFYDDDLKVKSKLTANYAMRYEKEKRMEAKQNVVVTNEKGDKLNTEHLIWDEEKKLIYTEEFVKITTADEILMGDGMESNEDFSKYKIKYPTGTISLHDDEKK